MLASGARYSPATASMSRSRSAIASSNAARLELRPRAPRPGAPAIVLLAVVHPSAHPVAAPPHLHRARRTVCAVVNDADAAQVGLRHRPPPAVAQLMARHELDRRFRRAAVAHQREYGIVGIAGSAGWLSSQAGRRGRATQGCHGCRRGWSPPSTLGSCIRFSRVSRTGAQPPAKGERREALNYRGAVRFSVITRLPSRRRITGPTMRRPGAARISERRVSVMA